MDGVGAAGWFVFVSRRLDGWHRQRNRIRNRVGLRGRLQDLWVVATGAIGAVLLAIEVQLANPVFAWLAVGAFGLRAADLLAFHVRLLINPAARQVATFGRTLLLAAVNLAELTVWLAMVYVADERRPAWTAIARAFDVVSTRSSFEHPHAAAAALERVVVTLAMLVIVGTIALAVGGREEPTWRSRWRDTTRPEGSQR